MNFIGLSITEMSAIMVKMKTQLTKDQEPQIQQNISTFIKDGYSKNDAELRARMIGIQSVDTAALLGIMVENNRKILLDLKAAGLIT